MALPARLTFALITAALLAYIPLLAQTDEWTVYAGVVDRTGTPVMGLGNADFAVRENGDAREILRVSPATDSLRVAVLVDTSQEMRNELIDIRQGLRGFVTEIDRRHEVSLTGFGGPPIVLVDYTRDLKRLELQARVDESDVGSVAPGAAAVFTVDAYPRRQFTGTSWQDEEEKR